ncbi:unnamed protein product [Darwinula stevensoni]|uniref:C-type lectin n=1 Tax=Darwinula stevensoni TaxID=69355 RepID=A0A7R8XDB4_9CRUS|nr:unnamed protein product [Darwinula stevensoni]CAG0886629.1 unnamed protein product [Darwinula stevensoni]
MLEQPKVTRLDLLSNIGGIVGVCLGVSLITIFDITEEVCWFPYEPMLLDPKIIFFPRILTKSQLPPACILHTCRSKNRLVYRSIMILSHCFPMLGLLCALGGSAAQECGGILTESHGEIASPGYPESYPPSTTCEWEIQAPPTRKIILSFVDFNLEDTPDCISGDFLTVSDPLGQPQTFCGRDHPWMLESVGNRLTVRFFSDASSEHGFQFKLSYMTASRCDDGWEEFDRYCYYFSENQKNFTDARSYCLSNGGDLASVHSSSEQIFLQENTKTAALWIGAEPTGEGLWVDPWNFEFIDNTPEDYQNVWDGEDPWILGNVCDDIACGIKMLPDKWQDRDCREERQVLCASQVSHDSGWYNCGGVFTHLSSSKMNFDEARAYCLSFPDSDMASVSDGDQQISLALCLIGVALGDTLDSAELWIGLLKDGSGDWRWVDGSPFTYERWEDEYPQDDSSKCAVMVSSSWEDAPAAYKYSFVCKKLP